MKGEKRLWVSEQTGDRQNSRLGSTGRVRVLEAIGTGRVLSI